MRHHHYHYKGGPSGGGGDWSMFNTFLKVFLVLCGLAYIAKCVGER